MHLISEYFLFSCSKYKSNQVQYLEILVLHVQDSASCDFKEYLMYGITGQSS